MAGVQILTSSTSTQNSIEFRADPSPVNQYNANNLCAVFIEIYGTVGTGSAFDLQYKAQDGSFYSTNDSSVITGIGKYMIPVDAGSIYRLSYTVSSGGSISAYVRNGALAT